MAGTIEVQHGDLAVSDREKLFLVLEGVLANVHIAHHPRRFRRSYDVNHVHWYEIPLKRMIVTKERYPQYELNVITFLGDELAEQAAAYLDIAGAPYDEIKAWEFDTFCTVLPVLRRVRAVYDSDPERLDHYGQAGVAVVAGNDW